MRHSKLLWIALACASACGLIAFTGFPSSATLDLTGIAPLVPAGAPCLVTPIPAIVDPQAIAFENGLPGTSSGVDVDGLTSGTARALARFQHVISSKGGSMKLTSAYRPPAYQQHLQAVWDKWMHQLRENREPACQSLRTEVAREFIRHSLLETQRPVDSSDHTRGVAFDARIQLPEPKPHTRHRFSLDGLARLCRLLRPDILHDPVHFRFALAPRHHRVRQTDAAD